MKIPIYGLFNDCSGIFKKTETVRKTLSIIALSVGLFSTTVFANTSANYSFGFDTSGDSGKPKLCFTSDKVNCGTIANSFTIRLIPRGGTTTPNETGFDIGFTFTRTKESKGTQTVCKETVRGSMTCIAVNCEGQLTAMFSPACK